MNTSAEGASSTAVAVSAPQVPGLPESDDQNGQNQQQQQQAPNPHLPAGHKKRLSFRDQLLQDYATEAAYLNKIEAARLAGDTSIIHKFVHLRPIIGIDSVPVKGKQNLKRQIPKVSPFGGATIMIEIDYKAQVVRAGLSLVHTGGVINRGSEGEKSVGPDTFSRLNGRFEACGRILNGTDFLQRTDQQKHSYVEITLNDLNQIYQEMLPSINEQIMEILAKAGFLFKNVGDGDNAPALTLEQFRYSLIEAAVLEYFYTKFKQIKNYY